MKIYEHYTNYINLNHFWCIRIEFREPFWCVVGCLSDQGAYIFDKFETEEEAWNWMQKEFKEWVNQ